MSRLWQPDNRTRIDLREAIARTSTEPPQVVRDPPPTRRPAPQFLMGIVVADIAPNDTGLVAYELGGDRTQSAVQLTCRNIHGVTLEQDLRVILWKVNGVIEYVALPFDYSACDAPESPVEVPF